MGLRAATTTPAHALVLMLAACTSSQRDATPDTPAKPGHAQTPPRATAVPGQDAGTHAAPGDAGRTPHAAARDVAAPDAGSLGAFDASATASPAHGGTITFQDIGAPGWFPSRRDPASGDCSAYQDGSCCMTKHEISGDALTPWDEDVIMTLRGPITARQIAVYQPMQAAASAWSRVADWDARAAQHARGLAFDGDATQGASFAGTIGNKCLVDVMSDREFACGPGSVPYCEPPAAGHHAGYGFSGSKLVVMLLAMPHDGDGTITSAQNCSNDASDNWYDAPWIGFSLGELVRAGKFGNCQCYSKDPAQWWLGDGCGQFNAFEVVNDNNASKNLDVFSTNFFGYQGYIGEGPCGSECDTSMLAPEVDLIDKSTSREAMRGAIASPQQGPGAAFRRPSAAPRYFLVSFDADARTVQLAVISPGQIPAQLAALLPELPEQVPTETLRALSELRLPH